MKNSNKEFWVEYDFEDTPFGNRPNMIRIFRNKAEAEAFAATTKDGRVAELTLIEN